MPTEQCNRCTRRKACISTTVGSTGCQSRTWRLRPRCRFVFIKDVLETSGRMGYEAAYRCGLVGGSVLRPCWHA